MNEAQDLRLIDVSAKTALQILEEHNRSVVVTKLVAKRFPDAYQQGGKWVSPSINSTNAKGLKVELLRGMQTVGTDQVAGKAKLYVTLRPKGCERVRVYAQKSYKLTATHIETLLEDNSKLMIKSLAHVLSIQE